MYIYLHGFNSSGDSAKGKYFAQSLAPVAVHTPSYPSDPDAAITHLQHRLQQLWQHNTTADTPTLIGSSLGGFYAQFLARQFNMSVVLINPALQPALTLAPYLGWQTNFYTSERDYFGKVQLERLMHYDIPLPCAQPVSTLVLLDAGDELIDYRIAQARYTGCAKIIVYPGGNHQFQHLREATAAIQDFHKIK